MITFLELRIEINLFFPFSGHLEQGCPTFSEENKLMGAPEDDEYARIMSRLEELEKELAAKSYGENEKWDTNAAESDGEED